MAENSGWLANKINELLSGVASLNKKTTTILSSDKSDYKALLKKIEEVEAKINALTLTEKDIEKEIKLILEYVAPPPPPPLPTGFVVTVETA